MIVSTNESNPNALKLIIAGKIKEHALSIQIVPLSGKTNLTIFFHNFFLLLL